MILLDQIRRYVIPTSRERVMTAVNHGEPDRIPIDLGGHRSSGIMAIAYNKLKDHSGIESGEMYVYDFVQQLAIIEPEVLDRFGVDTIELGRGFALNPEDWHDWVLPDGTPCKIPAFIHPIKVGNDWHVYHEDGTLITIQKEGCLYFEQTCFPPVQTSAKDMEPERLKREFGKDICRWGGGCDTQAVLPQGAPEEVAANVRQRVDILAPGGGFVFQQVHNIMADVPPENIVAMLDVINP